MSKAAVQDAGDRNINGRYDTATDGTAAADLVGLYAACGRPAPVVIAVADPGRALTAAAALTRPSTSLAAAQVMVLCVATLTLADLATGDLGSSAAGPVVVAFMPLVAGCSTVARDRSERRRAFVLGLTPLAVLVVALLGALWTADSDGQAAVTLALWAGLATACLACLTLLAWPVAGRLRLAHAHPGLLHALGWVGVLRGMRPLAPTLAPLLGEALAEKAAEAGRFLGWAACRGVPTQTGHGRTGRALERACVRRGLGWVAPGGALGRGCPPHLSVWRAARREAEALQRCHGPVAPVATPRARAALAAADATEAVLDAAWLLEGVSVIMPTLRAGPGRTARVDGRAGT